VEGISVNRRIGRTAAAAVALAAAVTVTACSSGGNSTSTTSSDNPLTGAAPKGVTLTLWHNAADPKAVLDLYKAYEAYSGNTISLVDIPPGTFPDTIQSKWATGARPDLLEWHGNLTDFLALNGTQNMVDLTSLSFVKKEGSLAQLSGSDNGKTYAVTLGFPGVSGIFYNKQVLAKAGLQPPKSYADLASDCTVLKTKLPAVSPIFQAGGSGFPPQILSSWNYMAQYQANGAYATSIVNKTAKLNDSTGPFVAGLTAYQSLKNSGCFNKDATTATWEQSMKDLLAGTTAMVPQISDSVSLLDGDANGDTAKVDATIGFVGVSATSPVADFQPTPLGTFYVPKTGNTDKERAAVQFINFATGPGYANYVKEAGTIPTLSGATVPTMQGLWQDIYSAYKNGATLTFTSRIPGIGDIPAGEVLAGQLSPQAGADKLQTEYLQAAAASGS
jgi:raffinose/stachyose/melibiose transport system substrate-binding protein